MTRLAILGALWLLASPALAADAEALNGRCLEQLQFEGDYLLPRFPKLSIAYRRSGERQYFFLVEPVGPGTDCGRIAGHVIVSSLPLRSKPKDAWYGVNFDCRNSSGVKPGDTLIVLFKGNGSGLSLDAWKIDARRRLFVKTESVECYSFT